MIRPASFSDIPGIVLFLQGRFLHTHYAASGIAAIDVAETKRLLMQSIQRHGGKHGGATWICVAEKDGNIEGLVLGTLARIYSIFDRMMATYLFWLASEKCDPQDTILLIKSMIMWAKSCPGVVEIHCEPTAAIADDLAKAAKILEHMGMKPYGTFYRMELAQWAD
jgi:hypothetical protein